MMRARDISVCAALALLLLAAPLWSSLESAKALYRQGRFPEARQEIEDRLAAGPEEAERSRLLDLLGAVAARQGDYWKALETWQLLIGEYPESPGAEDAAVKVSLVAALLECRGEGDAPELAVGAEERAAEEPAASEPPPAAAQPVPEPAPEPETAVPPAPVVAAPAEPGPAAEPEPAAPPAPVVAAPPAPESVAPPAPVVTPSAAPGGSGLVLVAASGKPYDAVEETSRIVLEELVSRGVAGESATGGIPVVEKSEALLPRLLEAVEERGAEGLLLLTANFSSMQRIEAELYGPDGNQIWRLKASGGTGWTGRGYSRTGINRELVDRFLEKLEERIGGPGLPVTGDG